MSNPTLIRPDRPADDGTPADEELSRPIAKPRTSPFKLIRDVLDHGGPGYLQFAITNICNAKCDFCNFAVDRFDPKQRRGVTLKEAKALTRHLLATGDRVFTLAFHSTSLSPGSTPYVRDEAQLTKFHAWLEAYFAFFSGEIGGVFMTPRALYQSVGGALEADQAAAE